MRGNSTQTTTSVGEDSTILEIAQENDERSPLAIGKTYNKNIDAKKLDVGDVIEWEENGDLQTFIIEDVRCGDKGFKF